MQSSDIPNLDLLRALSRDIRMKALRCHYLSNTSHIGSGFSCADILTVLYGSWLNTSPIRLNNPERDRFILSKGHAAAVYYATLAEFGYIPKEWLGSYCQGGEDCMLGGHVHHLVPELNFHPDPSATVCPLESEWP